MSIEYGYPFIRFNPETLDCGQMVQLVGRSFDLEIWNDGDVDLVIDGLVSSAAQVVISGFSTPFVISGFSSLTISVVVTPSGLGAGSASIESSSNGINNPVSCNVSWTGVAALTVALTVDPTEWLFDNQKIGTTSVEKVFTIRNTGTVAVTVAAPTFPANFNAGPTLPAYPVVVGVSGTLDFGVRFAPTVSAGFFQQNVSVNSNAAATPFLLTLSGMAYLIVSVYKVNTGIDSLLFGFAEDSSISVQEMDSTDFDTETEASWKKLHNFGLLGVDKVLVIFWYHYEDLGEVEILFVFVNQTTGATTSHTRNVGTVGADGYLKLDSFELEPPVEGENILLRVLKGAGDGQLSIVDFGFRHQPSTNLLGTFSNRTNITPAFIATGVEMLMFGFQNAVQEMDPTDFEPETEASIENTILLPFQSDVGLIPGFTFEKGIYRVYFRYENYGIATVNVKVTSMRSQVEQQEVTIGSVAADHSIEVGVADIAVSDEVHRIMFEKVEGAFFLVDYVAKYELQGERKK